MPVHSKTDSGRPASPKAISRRFQFSLKALLVAMLVVAAFFGGVRFEGERRRRADEAALAAAAVARRMYETEMNAARGLLDQKFDEIRLLTREMKDQAVTGFQTEP
jgi:hypothetical protein